MKAGRVRRWSVWRFVKRRLTGDRTAISSAPQKHRGVELSDYKSVNCRKHSAERVANGPLDFHLKTSIKVR